MFFDCTALLAGLVATVVSRWPANDRFSYGYDCIDIETGFISIINNTSLQQPFVLIMYVVLILY